MGSITLICSIIAIAVILVLCENLKDEHNHLIDEVSPPKLSDARKQEQPKGVEKCLKKCTPQNAEKKYKCSELGQVHGSGSYEGSCVDGLCSYCLKYGSICKTADEEKSLPCCGESVGQKNATSIACIFDHPELGERQDHHCVETCHDPQRMEEFRCYDSDGFSPNFAYISCKGKKPNTYTNCPINGTYKTCGAKGGTCEKILDCCKGYSCKSGKCQRTCVKKGERCNRNCCYKGNFKDQDFELRCDGRNSEHKSVCVKL